MPIGYYLPIFELIATYGVRKFIAVGTLLPLEFADRMATKRSEQNFAAMQ